MADSILFEVASWVIASMEFGGLTINDVVWDWHSCLFSFLLSNDMEFAFYFGTLIISNIKKWMCQKT